MKPKPAEKAVAQTAKPKPLPGAIVGAVVIVTGVVLLTVAAFTGKTKSEGGFTLQPGQSTIVTVSSTVSTPPCVLGSSTDTHEAYTARLLWWMASRRYLISVTLDLENNGNAHVLSAEGMSQLQFNPCGDSLSRLATVLHEAGHIFEPDILRSESERQIFADAVARRSAARLKLDVGSALPPRDYRRTLVQQIEKDYAGFIDQAATTVATIAQGAKPDAHAVR